MARYREDPHAEVFDTRPTDSVSIVLVTSGGYWIESRHGTRVELARYGPGSAGLTRPGASSRLRWWSIGDGPLESVHVHLEVDVLARAAEELGARLDLAAIDALHVQDDVLSALVHALALGVDRASPAPYAAGLARSLATHLLTHRPRPVREGRGSSGLEPAVLARVTEWVHAHLDEEISVPAMAELAHLSPYHFLRMFKQATGSTPHHFVMRARLRRGADLLRATDLPVQEVAAMSGYRSRSHFAAAFRQRFGKAPAAFRQGTEPGGTTR